MDNFYLIGIGGISMSAIALILKKQGHNVLGSDINHSSTIDSLRNNGIEVYIGHDENNIKPNYTVIYTAAIKEDNVELKKAKELGLRIFERAEFLGNLMKSYKNVINISGTHGKTTTTSMIGYILSKAQLDPTILVGAYVKQLGGNFKIGNNKFLVAEACEYFDSFLKFKPTIGVILNIDNDHLDYFKNTENIKKSFANFGRLIPPDGFLVVNGDDKNSLEVTQSVSCPRFSFSVNNKNGDFWADNLKSTDSIYQFDMYYRDLFIANISLSIPGKHNVYNAMAAASVCYLLGIAPSIFANALHEFEGANRRIEKKAQINNFELYDDYAHHPTEIKTTLSTLKEKCKGRLIAVFQPHTYTRLVNLMDDFVDALKIADKVILSEVYAAREKNVYNITSANLYQKLLYSKVDCFYSTDFEQIASYVLNQAKENDIVVTIGAGNINKVIDIILTQRAEIII